jgi:outer membrane protein insertion porin family
MKTRSGEIFREMIFEEDVENLLQRYEDSGHPYTEIEPFGFLLNPEAGLVGFGLRILEGPEVRIENILVKGNQITRGEVVTRELRLKKGDLYSQRKIDRGRRSLERLSFLKVKKLELVNSGRANKGTIEVEIDEGRMNRIEGLIGYKPDEEGGEEELIGAVDVSFENFLGTGRELRGNWERLTSLTTTLQFGYKEPWLFKIPLHGSVDFLHTLQDTQYTETRLDILFETPLTPILSGILGVGGHRIVPDSLNPISRSTEYHVTLGADLNTREDPRKGKGLHYRLKTETGIKRNYPSASLPQVEKEKSRVVKWRYGFKHWYPLMGSSNSKQVIYFSLQGGEVRSNEKEIPSYDLIKIGGAKTLRGYREQAIWGSRVVWANLEYRYLLTSESRLFLFLDGGYYEDEVETREFLPKEFPQRTLLPGYGVGLLLESRLGLFGIAYGLGKGDDPLDGKIHFSLGTEF